MALWKFNLQITKRYKVQYISESQLTKPLPQRLDEELPKKIFKGKSKLWRTLGFFPTTIKKKSPNSKQNATNSKQSTVQKQMIHLP